MPANRIIKFRAVKDDMATYLVYGCLVYDNSGIPRITNDGGYTYTTCLKGTEGQFTGLLDCKGVEIYEGDIVKRHYGYPERELYIEEIKDIRIDCEFCDEVEYEVIGNIYESPELLEAKDGSK